MTARQSPPGGAGAPPPAAVDEHPDAPATKIQMLEALKAAAQYMPYWRPTTAFALAKKRETLAIIRAAIAQAEVRQ